MTNLSEQMKTVDPLKAKEYFEDKMSFTTGPVEVSHWIEERFPVNVVDVRAEEDYNRGHAPMAVSLPKSRWNSFQGLSRDKNNVLYCYSQTCHLAALAAVKFASRGYPVVDWMPGSGLSKPRVFPIAPPLFFLLYWAL